MKKVMMIFVAMSFASMIMLSCTQKAEDIKLSNLKTACDYIDAMEKISDAAIKTKGDKSKGDLSQEDKNYLKVLKNKIEDIGGSAKKKYTPKEFQECSNYEIAIDKIKKAMDIIDGR